MIKKAIIAAALCGAMVASMAGCSGGEQTEPVEQQEPASTEAAVQQSEEPEPLEVAESGYYYDDYGMWYFAAIIDNPNMGWAAQNIQLSVSAKDADGKIVGTQDCYLTLLFANGSNAVCGAISAEGAESLEFQIVENSNMWVQEETQQAEYDESIYVQNVNETVDDYGYTTVAGEAVSEATGAFVGASANIVFRDAEGKIVGGNVAYISDLPAGSTVPFSVDYMSNVPEHDKTEVHINSGYPVTE